MRPVQKGIVSGKTRVGALAAALIAGVIASFGAAAAEIVEWREPNGQYSLRYDSAVWRLNDAERAADEVVLLQHKDDVGAVLLTRCAVRQSALPTRPELPVLDQDKLNSLVARAYTEEGARAFFRDAVIGAVSQQSISGKTVADIELTAITEAVSFSMHYRFFALMRDGAGYYHEVRCASSIPVDDTAHQSMSAILQSLQFTPEPQ